MYRNVERGAGNEIFVIEIASHNPRRSTVEAVSAFGRSVAHAAEKWVQRNVDTGSEMRDHALGIEGNDFDFRVRIIVRKITAAGTERIVGIGNRQLYRQDLCFEHIANLSALNENWTSENVSAGAFVFDLVGNVAKRLLYLISGQTGFFEALRTIRYQCLNFHGVARLDAQDGRSFGVVVAPRHSFRRGL